MKKYYIQKDGIKKGPYSVEDLKSMNITEETQVCTHDFGWDEAVTFSELEPLFKIRSNAIQQNSQKKFFISENNIKKGPYSVEDLKSMNITEETQVCTDDFGWDEAVTFSELEPLFKKEPVKIVDYRKDTFFGYKLADNNARRFHKLKTAGVSFSLALIFFNLAMFSNMIISTYGMIFLLACIIVFHFASTVYLVLKKSQPGFFCGNLRLITSDKGEFINKLAEKNYSAARKIAILYAFIPSYGYLGRNALQSLNEEAAGVYLVKAE